VGFPSNELSSILWPCRKGTGWWPICRGFLIAFRTPKSNHVFFRFWKIFWKHMEVKSPCWPFFWEDREMFPVTGVWVRSLSTTRFLFHFRDLSLLGWETQGWIPRFALLGLVWKWGIPICQFSDLAPQRCSLGSNWADDRFQVISVIYDIWGFPKMGVPPNHQFSYAFPL
jgi:hypothetical protein